MPKPTPKARKARPAPRSMVLGAGWAAGLLALLTVLLFHQVALEGQTFAAPDATAPVGFVRMGEHSLYQDHVYPLWNPYVFLGMPSFASGAYNPLIYPPDWPLALVAKVVPLPEMTWLLLYYFLGAFFFFLLAREWGARPEGALLGGVAFMFAPNLVAVGSHGHGSQLVNSAYIPLLLWLTARWMRRGGLQDLGWLALAGGFQMLRGHAQIAFYTWLAVGLYVVIDLIAGLPSRSAPSPPARTALLRAAAVAAAMGLSFAIAGFYNLPLRDYAQYSIRGGGVGGGVGMDYATAWSLAGRELPTIVIPGAVGFGGATYWGTMPFTDYPNAYVGMITVAIGLLGFLVWNRTRAFALALAAIALMISFGKHLPLYGFLYQHLPLFNKFRVPVMILVLFQVATALGLSWGWSAVLESEPTPAKASPDRLGRALLVIGAALAALFVVGGLGQAAWRSGYEAAVHAARPDLPPQAAELAFRGFISDLVRVSLLGLVALAVAWLAWRRTVPGLAASGLALALLLFELWPVSGQVMAPVIGPRVPHLLDQGRDDVVEFLEKVPAPFRIWPIADIQSNRFAGFGVASIGGYHAAKPRLYQDLVDSLVVPSPSAPTAFSLPWMRLLDIRYVVSPEPLNVPWLRSVYQGSAIVFENPTALDRATVVPSYRVAPTPQAVIDSINANREDVARVTWLDHDPHLALGGPRAEPGRARVVRYRLNDVSIDVETATPALLRLADLWYPDWVASVDGRRVEILKADYLLRAVAVPAGRHRVEFRFESGAVRRGLAYSLVGFAAALALLGAGTWRARRVRGAEQAA